MIAGAHYFRAAFLTLAAVIVAACGQTSSDSVPAAPPIDSLVSADWLAANLDAPDLVVIDASVMLERTEDGGFRSVSGRAHYETQHIPGAQFADLKGELADPDSTLNFAVPTPEAFAATMARLGVGDDTRVVIYDANRTVWAARVWWMLRWIGFDNAALLDGGLAAWTDAGHPVTADVTEPTPQELTVNLRPELIVEQDEVHAAISDERVHLIDSMPEAHYRGEFAMYARPGHIPTASNVSTQTLLEGNGAFKSTDELAGLFDGNHDERAITYCGGGIAASANAFIMTRLGYKDVAVYTASLQEWAADPENPLETE